VSHIIHANIGLDTTDWSGLTAENSLQSFDISRSPFEQPRICDHLHALLVCSLTSWRSGLEASLGRTQGTIESTSELELIHEVFTSVRSNCIPPPGKTDWHRTRACSRSLGSAAVIADTQQRAGICRSAIRERATRLRSSKGTSPNIMGIGV
jgi:hypothetical protein